MARKHHHIVSEGYQRLFANADGIQHIDKELKTGKVIGTKSAFARKHFSSYRRNGEWFDELEDEWARLENFALPHIHRLNSGARDSQAREAAKVLAAVHYARGYAFDIIMARLIEQQGEEAPDRIAALQSARDAFEADNDRPPQPGEIEALVTEHWRTHFEARTFVVTEMAHAYNKTMEILEPYQIQLVWPRSIRVDFVFGDIPLVHSSSNGRLSVLGGLPLGEANQVFFPLGPRLAALFTTRKTPDCAITVEQAQMLNLRSWKTALRFVGAHPETHAKRSVLQWDLRIAV